MNRINRQRREFLSTAAVLILQPRILLARSCQPATAQQTEGPFYPSPFLSSASDLTADNKAMGDIHLVKGRVVDLDCRPIAGVQVDLWQANAQGKYRHSRDRANPAALDPAFQGLGRVITDRQGDFLFRTIKPGSYTAGQDWVRPPHLHFKVWRAGQVVLTTQMYFAGESLNDRDLILQGLSTVEQNTVMVSFTAGKTQSSGFFQITIPT